MTDSTNTDGYEPTNAEKKLLEVLVNPEHRFLTITKLCEQAGISRETYYVSFSKPDFVRYYKDKARDLVDQAIMPVINTFAKMAKAGSFQHGKALLDMANMSNDEIRVKGVLIKGDPTNVKESAQAYQELLKGDRE